MRNRSVRSPGSGFAASSTRTSSSRGSFDWITASSARQNDSRCLAVAGPVPLKSATP